jgi:hypothetical protein
LALLKLNRFSEAKEVYREGLKVDPENTLLKDGLEAVMNRQGKPGELSVGVGGGWVKGEGHLVKNG